MKSTKTTLIAIMMIAVVSFSASAQDEAVTLKAINKDTYQLSYLKACPCQVEIQITNQKGKKLFSEKISQKKPFVKPYNFRKLDDNEFEFKVVDEDGVYSRIIKRTEAVNMLAGIISLEDQRAKVIVEGDVMAPIFVNVYDHQGILIFDDYIDRTRAFSRIYDLSKVSSKDLKIEVVAEGQTLATAKY